jgi:2-methylisocitrate lyase-like PEP mutase family enzyme
VREYEAAGAAALHLEDQVWPKRCGFLEGKEVIPLPQMLAKLRAACDARHDPAFVIIGRSDALQPHGWDEVERRSRAFLAAGADLVFVDGIRTLEDLDEYGRRLGDVPRLYNGQLLSTAEIEQRGFSLMIHTATLGAIFSATRAAFEELGRSGALGGAADVRSFADMLELLGVSEQLALAAKYER